jgi:hypothetical protein
MTRNMYCSTAVTDAAADLAADLAGAAVAV